MNKFVVWRYRNTLLLCASLCVFFLLAQSGAFHSVVKGVGALGYGGALIAGIFFVSTFTVAPAGVLLFYLGQSLNPFLVAFFAGVGAVAGDYILFRFLKDHVFDELRPVFMKLGGTQLTRLMATPYFAWLAPVLGAIIIASPFPDELGVGLMGISRLRHWQFLLISFLLNTVGILFVILLAQSW